MKLGHFVTSITAKTTASVQLNFLLPEDQVKNSIVGAERSPAEDSHSADCTQLSQPSFITRFNVQTNVFARGNRDIISRQRV